MSMTLLANALRFDPTHTATLQRRVRVLVGNEFAVSPSHRDCVRSRIGMYAPPTPSFLQEYGRVLARAYRAGYDRSLYDAHRPLLARLGVNAVSDITDVTDSQRTAIADLLRSAAEKGQNPRKIATELARKTGLSKDRALLIAQTELIGAYAEGQLDALEAAGVSDVTAQVEWVTAGDSRVCPRCSAMEGIKLKIADARGKIPLHPRCRCAWVPAEGLKLRDEPTTAPSPETPTPPTAPAPVPVSTVAPASTVVTTPIEEVVRPVTPPPTPKPLPSPKDLQDVKLQYIDSVEGKKPSQAAKDKAYKLLGTSDPQVIAGMGNATNGSTVRVSSYPEEGMVIVSTKGNGVEAIREFKRKGGKLIVENISIRIDDKSQYKGKGVELFARQVVSLREGGADQIVTTAAGSKGDPNGYNGYYTWPRMGYDGPIPKEYLNKMPKELRAQAKDPNTGKSSLLALYETEEGREWWKENGGMVQLKFDLREGSKSRQVLEAYVREREQRPPKPGSPVQPSAGGAGREGGSEARQVDRPIEPGSVGDAGTRGRSSTSTPTSTPATQPVAPTSRPVQPARPVVPPTSTSETTLVPQAKQFVASLPPLSADYRDALGERPEGRLEPPGGTQKSPWDNSARVSIVGQVRGDRLDEIPKERAKVDPKELVYTQPGGVVKDKLEDMVGQGPPSKALRKESGTEPIVIRGKDGKLYAMEGNHRALWHMAYGEKMDAIIVDEKDLKVTSKLPKPTIPIIQPIAPSKLSDEDVDLSF